ncbi:MAG: hypothetical protein Q8P20_09350 [bacterium]|nr:hypothetical protein [bacterium]
MAFKESMIDNSVSFDAASRKRDKDFENLQLDKKTEIHELSNEWDKLLSLFGTEKAKNNFISLCEEYKRRIVKAKESNVDFDQISSSDIGCADIHNTIMKIIQKLNVSKAWPPEIQSMLNKLQDRNVIKELINYHINYRL